MAVRFAKVAEWLFVSAMVCNELQRVTFPGFPKLSRDRIGVKAAHIRAKTVSCRSRSLPIELVETLTSQVTVHNAQEHHRVKLTALHHLHEQEISVQTSLKLSARTSSREFVYADSQRSAPKDLFLNLSLCFQLNSAFSFEGLDSGL